MGRAALRPSDTYDLLEACLDMIDAHNSRAATAKTLTMHEQQAIAVLWIRLEELREPEDATTLRAVPNGH